MQAPSLRRRQLLALGAGLAGLPAAAAPAAPPALRRGRLANGLDWLALPLAGASVAVQLHYRVGSRDDPPGRSGFAHLFEHMMFKSTRHMAAEQFDRLTEDVGGSNNAFTAEDVTVYHSVVPAAHLEPLLWAEAERMANLQVDRAAFESERAVVQEEYRQRVLADPYGRLFHAIPVYGYQQHPYRRPVIGSMEDLEAATLDDVRAFHAGFYRPDNALLVVAGAFDAARLEGWIEHYFGSIRAPREPVPRRAAEEPKRLRDAPLQRLVVPGVPLPAALVIWQGPRADSADAPALQAAQALLALGDASRLGEALVQRRRLARSVGFECLLNAEAGLLAGHAIGAPGLRPKTLLAELTREIQRVAEEPLLPAELERVRALQLTQDLVARETPEGRALALGQGLLLRGDALAAERDRERLRALTVAELQRVLRRYLLQGAKVSLLYVDERSRAE